MGEGGTDISYMGNCRCEGYGLPGLTTYTFLYTGETRPIISNLTCYTKNLIYMIQCNRCNLQYIGETKRRLKDRFNEHRRTIDNPNNKSKPTTAAEHFLSSANHTANDMQLIPIEKIFSNRHSIRKARVAFWLGKYLYFPSCSGGTISLHHSLIPSLPVRHLEPPIWEGQGCTWENLNLTPKED